MSEIQSSRPVRIIQHRPLPKPPEPPKGTIGLGDAVAAAAQPVARAIDALLGTKLEGCGPCQKRREYLNSIVPDIARRS